TAMLLQLKAVFAAVFGMVFLDESMTLSMWSGAALVACGCLSAQYRCNRRKPPLSAPALMDARAG
ncbi:MAG: EamA family transporter, partial [Deltaproteobacteria bacterium]|nr:EamA family transporter [Deltaproteobacteria bacterium]